MGRAKADAQAEADGDVQQAQRSIRRMGLEATDVHIQNYLDIRRIKGPHARIYQDAVQKGVKRTSGRTTSVKTKFWLVCRRGRQEALHKIAEEQPKAVVDPASSEELREGHGPNMNVILDTAISKKALGLGGRFLFEAAVTQKEKRSGLGSQAALPADRADSGSAPSAGGEEAVAEPPTSKPRTLLSDDK